VHIVLGLGNPGPEYARHRHNAGHLCVNRLARRLAARLERAGHWLSEAEARIEDRPVILARSRVWMNLSGRAAREVLDRHEAGLEHLIVVHDEADLPFGTVRIKAGGGHGGHNGLRSILEVLGEGGFTRVRLGLGRPESARTDLADWVLQDFAAAERSGLDDLLERGADAAAGIVTLGTTAAMNRFNGPPSGGVDSEPAGC